MDNLLVSWVPVREINNTFRTFNIKDERVMDLMVGEVVRKIMNEGRKEDKNAFLVYLIDEILDYQTNE